MTYADKEDTPHPLITLWAKHAFFIPRGKMRRILQGFIKESLKARENYDAEAASETLNEYG